MKNQNLTYDVIFQDENSSDQKGFTESLEYCQDYINRHNGTNESYFADYKGGVVEIYCNETEEVIYSTEVF